MPVQQPTRRTVLGAGLGALGLVIVGTGAPVAEAATAPAPLRRRDFTPSLRRVFVARRSGHTHRLRLTAIQNLRHSSAAHHDRCFSLLFTPTGRAVLPDGIYRLKAAGRPAQSLFLVRVGTGRTMQAIINRAH